MAHIIVIVAVEDAVRLAIFQLLLGNLDDICDLRIFDLRRRFCANSRSKLVGRRLLILANKEFIASFTL